MPHDIFISYSRKNKDAVLSIKNEIERRLGLTCWIDLSDIPSGAENFKEKVIPGINGTSIAFLFFLSKEVQESEYAMKEIGFAQKRAKKRVILVRFNDDAMTDKFYFDYQDADIIDWRETEQKEKLLRDLKKWVQQQGPSYLTVSATLDGRDVQGAKLSVDGLTMDLPDTMTLSYGTEAGPLDASFSKDGVQFTSRKDRFPVNWHGKTTLFMPLERRDKKTTIGFPPKVIDHCRSGIAAICRMLSKETKYSRNALLAGWLGLTSLLSLFSSIFAVAGLLAVFFAIRASRDMKRDPTKRGKGWAFLGLIIGSFVSFCALFACLGDA